MGRYLTGRNLSPLVLSAGQLIAASGLLALALPFGGTNSGDWRPDAIAALLIVGVIGTGFAYVLNYRIITDDGPVLASTVTYLLPVVAVLGGLIVLDEPVTTPPPRRSSHRPTRGRTDPQETSALVGVTPRCHQRPLAETLTGGSYGTRPAKDQSFLCYTSATFR